MKTMWELKFQILAALLLVAGIMSRTEGAAAMSGLFRSLGPVVLGGIGVVFVFRGIKGRASGFIEKAMEEARKQQAAAPGSRSVRK